MKEVKGAIVLYLILCVMLLIVATRFNCKTVTVSKSNAGSDIVADRARVAGEKADIELKETGTISRVTSVSLIEANRDLVKVNESLQDELVNLKKNKEVKTNDTLEYIKSIAIYLLIASVLIIVIIFFLRRRK